MLQPSLSQSHLPFQIHHYKPLFFVTHCRAKNTAMAHSVRIVVVGDVHDDWDTQQDAKALQSLKPDLVLFTGDFGDENVELVKDVSSLDLPKAVILGNHDCWNTGKFSSTGVDSVEAQLACLGKEHVGYDRLDFPQLKLSVVGGRPFSCGGKKIFYESLIAKRYGVKNMNESARKIYESSLRAPYGNSIILLAHNGPTGLGSNMSDICGRDWVVKGGDHGDPDLAEAISFLKDNSQLKIPLVIFGHMHKRLAYSDDPRTMLVTGDNGIFYLNGAIVPRVEHLTTETVDGNTSSSGKYPFSDRTSITTKRVFTVIELINGKPRKITESWVTVNEEVNKIEESILFESL
ncbi:hypothetical protein SUGI_0529090 [Cryptomeria japonica]|uniref:uncharacterized protein LOC131063776 n=1 Tax=Cryptomeria japonica TaxID=3369 RepID=UPI0024089C51|nr:uncharacterized protein LOC131063776 [Cryptomeria japonica]GLJ27002.1 hypothetical protein SUGI_0529090 [Cryptomeria japonica]